jgi:hypothetical protein
VIVTVANGTNTLTFTSIAIVGPNAADFTEMDSCLPELLPHVVCTIVVNATPSGTGVRTATLQINDSDPSSPQMVALTIIGGTPPPPPPTSTVMVSPASLVFPPTEVTISSASQPVTVTNTGAVAVTLFPFFTGPNAFNFSAVPGAGCFPSIAVSGNCTIAITFHPSLVGLASATLQLTGNFTGSPMTVGVSGTGTARIATLTPSFFLFPKQVVGTTSAPQPFTLANTSSTVTLTNVSVALTTAVGTGFAISANTCGATLGPLATCIVSVTFDPPAATFFGNSLAVTETGDPAPLSAFIDGQGVNPAATLANLFQTSIPFGRQNISTQSPPSSVFLQNIGNTPLVFTVAITGTNSGDFSETDVCSATIVPGFSCDMSVFFTPTAVGPRGPATLTINSTTAGVTGVPQSLTLTGTGVTATTAALAPTSLIFPNTAIGVTSAPMLATFSNTGNRPLTITPPTVGNGLSGANPSDFSFRPVQSGGATVGCPSGSSFMFFGPRFNPQVACPIEFTFTPLGAGTRTATFTILDTSSNSPHTLLLQGTSGTGPGATPSPTSLSFGNQTVGVASSPMSVTLTNSGGTTLNLTTVAVSGPNSADFAIAPTTTCTNASTVAAAATCTVDIIFTASLTAGESATLTFSDNASPPTQTVPLSGIGVAATAPIVGLPANANFSTVPTGTTAMQNITLMNTGTAALVISSFGISGTNAPDFSQTNTCPPPTSSLAAGGSCIITLKFTPAPAGISELATLTVTDNAANSPQTVAIRGQGAVVTAALNLPALAFGNVTQGIKSGAMMVTLSDSVFIGLNITSIGFQGPNAADFSETDTCPRPTLGADSSCTISVFFTPSLGANTAETANLVVTDNAAASPTQTVALTGTGVTGTTSFSFSPAPGTTTQVTITGGSTAQFTIVLNPSASSVGPVSFACTGNPPTTLCAVTPSSGALTGSTPITLTVTLRTNCITSLAPPAPIHMPPMMPPQVVVLWLLSLLGLAVVRQFAPQTRLARVAPAVAMLLLTVIMPLFGTGCGSGSSVIAVPGQPTTPPGLYTITITATSGRVSQNIQLLVRVV